MDIRDKMMAGALTAQIFQVPAIIKQPKMMADNTLRFTVDCQEMTPEENARLFALNNKQGWFLFKINEIEKDEIPEDDAPEFEGQKSLSQRLRDVIFIYWKQQKEKGKTTKTFSQFREEWMENKIKIIKDNLD